MDLPLFVYGTLRDPDLLRAVLGRSPRADTVHPASAPGFRAVTYPGRAYPALVRSPGGVAEGLLLTSLSALDCELLDAYEGDEYRRGIVAAIVDSALHEAVAYLPTATIPAEAPDWSLSHWQQSHKSHVLVVEEAASAALGHRRPN